MELIERAIIYAARAHKGMTRKGKERPYILHPMEVMTIVASMTDDPNVIAAAALHDVVEDTSRTIKDIRHEFGDIVAGLVADESEDKREGESPESTWLIRKTEKIDRLRKASREVQMICMGDKLANLREIARDRRLVGDGIWERFNQKDKEEHFRYYHGVYEVLLEAFGEIGQIKEYRALLDEVFGKKEA